MNLNQYQHLSASPVQNKIAPALDLQRFGEGMGAFGLPGDCSSPSRYIRAAFYRLNSRCEDQERSRVAHFFHLLDTVAMPRGSVITEQELLDEWGREFLGEGLRRQTLCRFGVFNTGTWWDKTPDSDNHTMWVPISRNALNTNPKLKQNPGYDDIR